MASLISQPGTQQPYWWEPNTLNGESVEMMQIAWFGKFSDIFSMIMFVEIELASCVFEQNAEYVLIPICDHYHSIKSHLSTPSTGWQKEGRV